MTVTHIDTHSHTYSLITYVCSVSVTHNFIHEIICSIGYWNPSSPFTSFVSLDTQIERHKILMAKGEQEREREREREREKEIKKKS